ncbi:hypothetical protein DF268_45840 [Streptomyces sp. V2]|uniref:hypothetical protein n=1 Tax=unclassified Streptomyces TaxID=2593676 RepID=UPI000D66C1BC|nr:MULTISPECIES: hypothetical protein [unclassified Streptomyces]PWG06981.1 hypothetical protein DF268_45840 [Streptomyces sp. V2]QZZ28202.1 hypothetical protein A7X85_19745 [Streptomyces sp. ST1015]
MSHRISALISVLGVLTSAMLLVVAAREYHSGASALWLVGGAAIFLSAAFALVRDVRQLRAKRTG